MTSRSVVDTAFPIPLLNYLCAEEHFGGEKKKKRKTHSFSYTIRMNVLVLETNALKSRVEPSSPHSYKCRYERFSTRTSVEIAILTGTHLRKRAVATLSYSPESTLHPRVIYAIAFSARLNGVYVD